MLSAIVRVCARPSVLRSSETRPSPARMRPRVERGSSLVLSWRMLPASEPTLAASATTVIPAPVLKVRGIFQVEPAWFSKSARFDAIRTSPLVTASRPNKQRSVSVRPAPISPASPRISPRRNSSVTFCGDRAPLSPFNDSSTSPGVCATVGKRSATPRPTISETICVSVVPASSPCPTERPSRSTE